MARINIETLKSMEGGRKRGNNDTGSSCCGWNRKRAIQLSKYISEAHKLRSLEGKKHGTSPVQFKNRASDIDKFIQKHRNPGQIERDEGGGQFIRFDMKLVTRIMFGQPIIRSLSKMLSEYYREIYGVDLDVVHVQSNCCKGESFSLEGAQKAKWVHVNFTCNPKNDGDGDSKKFYFAELVLFRFRFTPLLCNVAASLPLDLMNGSGNSCTCLLKNPDGKIRHPSIEVYYDRFIFASKSSPLRILASIRFAQLAADNKSRKGPIWVFLFPTSSGGSTIQNVKARNVIPGPLKRAPISFEKTINIKDSRDIPVPKTILLLEGGKRATRPRRELALVVAKCIEIYGKPMPKRDPEIDSLSEMLPECHRRKYGVGLKAVNDLKIMQSGYYEFRREAIWFHMNFKAKIKQDVGGGGGDSSKLYFAEVVKIIVFYPPVFPCEYFMTVCVAVDQNDSAGNSSKCRMCSERICHPSPELYDSKCDFDPSKLEHWKETEKFLRQKFPRDTDFTYSGFQECSCSAF